MGEPANTTDLAFVDVHVHVACDDTHRFPRRPTGVGSQWWSEPDGSGPAVLRTTRHAGAAHVVVVQAVGAYGHDCACASDVVESSAGYASLVTSVDMTAVGLTAVGLTAVDLTAVDMASSPSACAGWRLFGVGDGAPWLDDERADLVWSRAAELDAVIVPTIFTDRLDSLAAVAARYPTVRVALDHCAFADMGGATGEQALLRLAEAPSIRLKVTTHVLDAWLRQGRLDEAFADLVAAFGTHRMCWGSDHPQHLGSTYVEKLALARHATRHLDREQQSAFFLGTAVELGWSPGR